MTTALTFETRGVLLTLKQVATLEQTPTISLQLDLTSTATIYTSDSRLLQDAKWSMTVLETAFGAGEDGGGLGTLSYANDEDRSLCSIVVNQSASRFNALLDMFRGGHASEISICIDKIDEMADYGRRWNTERSPTLALSNVSFEFPLPQNEA